MIDHKSGDIDLNLIDAPDGIDQKETYKKEINKMKDANYQLLKRFNESEKDRIEEVSKQNDKIISLHSQIVKLRSENERSGAIHQETQLELTRARKACRDLERALSLKDQQLKRTGQNNENIDELQSLLERKSQELESAQAAFSQKEADLLSKIDQLNQIVDSKSYQISQLEKVKENLMMNFNEMVHRMHSTKDATESLIVDRNRVQVAVKEKENELTQLVEENMKWKEEHKVLSFKLHRLEECFEAERNAHLESKYNTELLQLKLNEINSARENTHVGLEEANQVIDMMTMRLKEAEVALEEEAKNSKVYQDQIHKLRNDLQGKIVNQELELQKKINSDLSSSLHESNSKVVDVQKELNQARKKYEQIAAEHEELLQEIQKVVEIYSDRLSTSSRSSTPLPHSPRVSSGSKSTRQLIDQLKALIQNQGRRIQESTEEIAKLTSKTSKELSPQNDREMPSAQLSSVGTIREINHLRKRLFGMEKTINELQSNNQEGKQTTDAENQAKVDRREVFKSQKKREQHVEDDAKLNCNNHTVNHPQEVKVDKRDRVDPEKSPKKMTKRRNNNYCEEQHTGDAGQLNSSQLSWSQMKAELFDGVTGLVETLLKRHQNEENVDMNNSQMQILNRTVPEKDLSKPKVNADKNYRYKYQVKQESNRIIPMDNSLIYNRKKKQNIIVEDKTRACCCGDTERSSISNSAQKCSSCFMSIN